jgi:hypothetical protein
LTPGRCHVGRHTKLDNENKVQQPMEVDEPNPMPAVTPVGDKDDEPPMEIEMDVAMLEEAIVQRRATSPQAHTSFEGKETAAQVLNRASLTAMPSEAQVPANNSDTEEDSKPVAKVNVNDVGNAGANEEQAMPKAAPTVAIPLRIEADGPTYTNLWL